MNLILRPTDKTSGLYVDDKGDALIVTTYQGANYMVLWCEDEDVRDGDVVFRDASITAMRTEYEAQHGAEVRTVDVVSTTPFSSKVTTL